MGIVAAIRQAMQRKRQAGAQDGGVGVEDLEALNLAPLATVADETPPRAERRRRQEPGPQTGHVIMRRRAGDWDPAGADDTALDEQSLRRRIG